MNPRLKQLQPYPFEKLNALKAGIKPPEHKTHISLSIGEPKHQPPNFVLETLADNLDKVANYAATKGSPGLRESIATWIKRRFKLPNINPDTEILPVNGTREGIFAFVQASIDSCQSTPSVLMPNPFYQIYEGAALLAGAKPVFLNCHESNQFKPDLSQINRKTWQQCQILFLCTPGNPTGAVLSIHELQEIIALADKYDFIVASDECYSELYFNEDAPPAGLLEACAAMGRNSFERCIVFHSLSKRSNLPGLRSGFVAGDQQLIQTFLQYRTYHGCAMPLHTQLASIAAWNDETHVKNNRAIYREKFDRVTRILQNTLAPPWPQAGFYLWPQTPIDDAEFAQQLFAQENITVLPGSYLTRNTTESNPGNQRIRIALVAELEECIIAAERMNAFMLTL